jgi:hypothetical protein
LISTKSLEAKMLDQKETVNTREFAVKVDTELSELYDQIWTINSKIQIIREDIKHAAKYNSSEATIKSYSDKVDELLIQRAPLKDRVRELNLIYIADPWTRAFLVKGSDGHVHSSMECSTCFDTTQFFWLTQYSAHNEDLIVADAGETACTICYPSAPADVLNRPSKIVTADSEAKAKAKAERDAKKAERIAKEKANAPTASGEFLTYKEGKYTREIRTERTAVTEWLNTYQYANNPVVTVYYDGTPHTQESIDHQLAVRAEKQEVCRIIAQALAEKHGVSFETKQAELIAKSKKRG